MSDTEPEETNRCPDCGEKHTTFFAYPAPRLSPDPRKGWEVKPDREVCADCAVEYNEVGRKKTLKSGEVVTTYHRYD